MHTIAYTSLLFRNNYVYAKPIFIKLMILTELSTFRRINYIPFGLLVSELLIMARTQIAIALEIFNQTNKPPF